jgi:hypothetical protein
MGLVVILTTGGATGLVALALLAAIGLAMGIDTVGAVAVVLAGAGRGAAGAEALDGTLRGDNAGDAMGVLRLSLRASDDKVGVDAGAIGTAAGATAGLDPLALGAVGGTRLALVWNGAMGFNMGEAVGGNNVSK